MKTPAASESMCPASASRAREPETTAPIVCTSTTARVMTRTATRRLRCFPVPVAEAAMPCEWLWSCPMPTRLAPAELVQACVADTEVVGDFVHHGDGDFLDDVLPGSADVQDGLAEDGDPVRQGPGVPP